MKSDADQGGQDGSQRLRGLIVEHAGQPGCLDALGVVEAGQLAVRGERGVGLLPELA